MNRSRASRTVFIVGGIRSAVVVTTNGGRMTQRRQRFESPEAALAWCQQHRASLVYSAAENPASN